MIAFDLVCSHQHRFEGWFASSREYERQLADGLLICPSCGDQHIEKALSVPNVGRKGNQLPVSQPVGNEVTSVSNAAVMQDAVDEMANKLAEVQKKLLKDSEWVGGKFAEEARAIHYGETDDRLIHGETSLDEAQALAEEGVNVAPLLFPYVPDVAKN